MKTPARGLIADCSSLLKHERRLQHGRRHRCIDRSERLESAPSRGAGLAARDARIRVARATPGRCGILLHNRVRGRIKALDGGKSRTKKVPRGKFPPEPRRVQIGVQSSKFGMAGSPGML
jgi:hypothetical protein